MIGLVTAVRGCGAPPILTPAGVFAAAVCALLILLTVLWVSLRIFMPGEEKVITEVFRRRKA